MTSIRYIAPAVVAWSLLTPAYGQIDVSDAQKKLMAKRAAEADAYRKLAEAVKGLQITSDTYVKDFVAESDEIRTQLDTFIKGIRLGQPRWFDDLSCEVPAEVTVERVIQLLKEIHERHYKGRHIKAKDIEEMHQHVERRVLKVVGKGAPRFDLPPDLPEGVAGEIMQDLPPPPPEPFVPDLWRRIPPQARLGAELAAERDAQRKLLERILGLRVNSDTLVRDFVTEHDEIKTSAAGTIVGFTKKQTYYHADEPIVEVTLEVPVESVVKTIRELHTRCGRCGHVKGSDITEVTRSLKVQVFEATGTGVPNPRFLQAYNRSVAAPQRLPAWAMSVMRETGRGVPPPDKAGTPQGQLLAARAAEVDAKRRLAERIYGLRIWSETTVRDFVTEHDEVHTWLDAVIANAMVDRTRFLEDGTAEVTVILQGMEVWDAVRSVEGVPPGAPLPGAVGGPTGAVPPSPAPGERSTAGEP